MCFRTLPLGASCFWWWWLARSKNKNYMLSFPRILHSKLQIIYRLGFKVIVLNVGTTSWLSSFTRVWPQQIIYNSFVLRVRLMIHLYGFRYSLYFINICQSGSNASMHAENTVIDNCGDWHFLKDSICSLKEWSWIIDILFKFHLTLIAESHPSINTNVFMTSP